MSINQPNFPQTQIAHLSMGGFQSRAGSLGSGGVRGASQDMWACKASDKEMSVTQNEDSTEITTPGGYKITGFGQSPEEGGKLEIVSPDGKKTTVWGDPHVDQTDKDGKTKRAFDVKGRTTFTLPDKTVITMNMKPSTNGTDTTMLSDVMVTNGNKGVLMGDMMSGKGKMTTDEGYGPLMDEMVGDGNVLNLGKDGVFYEANEFGGKSKVTQARIDKAERELGDGFGEATQASEQMLMGDFMKHLQKMLGRISPDFLQSLESGSFTGYSSRYPQLGMQSLTLNTATAGWY